MPHAFHYNVFGLTLACDARLDAPDLGQDAAGPGDVQVDCVGVRNDGDEAVVAGSTVIVEETGGWLAVSFSSEVEGEWTRLRFGYADHHVQFDISPGGARVVVSWTAAVPLSYVSTLLFSTVMGYLLHRHGRLVIHGSVVAWRDRAFLFAGIRGAGKSTTVSALMQRGCRGVSDDVAALTRLPECWAVFPGLSGVRLTPEAQAVLAIPAKAATPLWSRSPQLAGVDYQRLEEKAVVSLGEPASLGSAGAPLPLAGIFLLPPRSDALVEPRVTALPAAAAVPQLAGQLLTPAWLDSTVDQERFLTLVDLARTTPVRIVDRPDALAALPELCDALLDAMAYLPR